MLRIILLGAAAIGLAIFADGFASDPKVASAVSPYAAVAPIYAPSEVEGRAAYVETAPGAARATDVSKGR